MALSLLENHTVDLLITGVGLMAATYALTREVLVKRPDAIVQAGVAGSLRHDLPLATVVAIKTDCVGDAGVNDAGTFQSLFQLKLTVGDSAPWKQRRLANEGSLLTEAGLPLVQGVTVNEITTSGERIAYYRRQLQAEAESMEGAALHYVALQEKIPFLQLRSLSNFIGERDKTKWQLEKAIQKLNTEVQNILTKLDAI